jgi:hypothetical protein
MSLPPQVLEGVADLIRNVCTKENNYTYYEFVQIGDLNYKVFIKLQDVDAEKEAKAVFITIKRED